MKYQKTEFSESGLEAISKMSLEEFSKTYKGIIKGDLKEAYKTLGGGKAKKVTKESKESNEGEEKDI